MKDQQCIHEFEAATLPMINVPSQRPQRTDKKYPTFIVIMATILKAQPRIQLD